MGLAGSLEAVALLLALPPRSHGRRMGNGTVGE